jgi:DNA-binding transcriptional ArsR family regulator
MLKHGRPVGISDIQKALGLSSPSVAQYHIKKLLRLGLVREEQGGYLIDKIVVENVIRIRRTSIPVQTGYVAFFGAAFLIILFLLRPTTITSLYVFAVIVNLAALGNSIWEARKSMKNL